MANPENAIFRHRHNENGTFDSICPHCYLTVGSTDDEQNLFLFERSHGCDPLRLMALASGPWPINLPSAP